MIVVKLRQSEGKRMIEYVNNLRLDIKLRQSEGKIMIEYVNNLIR